jgi:hypothetical protein
VCACAPSGSSRCPRRVAGSLVSLAAVGKNIASRFIGRPLDAVLRCASEISFFPLFLPVLLRAARRTSRKMQNITKSIVALSSTRLRAEGTKAVRLVTCRNCQCKATHASAQGSQWRTGARLFTLTSFSFAG